MKKIRPAFLSSPTLIRLIFLLLAILAVATIIREYHAYAREEWRHRATDADLLTNRISELANDFESQTLEDLGTVRSLVGIALQEKGVSGIDTAAHAALLEAFAQDHPDYHFLRYVSRDGVSLASGAPEDTAIEGKARSPFAELSRSSEMLGPGEILASDLQMHDLLAGNPMPLIYIYIPVLDEGEMIGAYEVGYDLTSLLKGIVQSERADESIVLVDNQGRYVIAPDGNTRLQETLFGDYPQSVTDHIFSEDSEGSFVHDGTVFSYRHLMTPGVRFGVSDRQYWVLLNTTDEDEAFADITPIKYNRLASATVFLLLILLTAFFIHLLKKRFPVSHHEKSN